MLLPAKNAADSADNGDHRARYNAVVAGWHGYVQTHGHHDRIRPRVCDHAHIAGYSGALRDAVSCFICEVRLNKKGPHEVGLLFVSDSAAIRR